MRLTTTRLISAVEMSCACNLIEKKKKISNKSTAGVEVLCCRSCI